MIGSDAMNTAKTFALGSLLITFGCGQAPEQTAQVASGIARTVNEVVISEGTPVATADLKIEGMSCEMMCGGAIKKALAALPGIADTEIKFHAADGDHAIVTYDASKVNDTQMVEAVQKINDGAYRVLAIGITKQVKGTANITSDPAPTKAADKNAEVSASVQDLIVPGLLGLLSRIVHI